MVLPNFTAFFLKWITGLAISTLVIWVVTAICTQNYYPKVWSTELNRNVPASGWSFSGRTEGWGETHFGAHGLVGVDGKLPEAQQILIWGDSFVEAFHVPDNEKMHNQLSGMLHAQPGIAPVTGIAVGQSWWSVADHVFRIPDYETLLGDVQLHVIHLFTLDDLYPDQYEGAKVSLFLSEPDLHFEKYDNEYSEIESPAKNKPLQNQVYRARLQFFLKLKKQLISTSRLQGLRFSIGNQSVDGEEESGSHRDWNRLLEPEWGRKPAPIEAWQFVLDSLREATDVPILFVYAPATPTVDHGRIITVNPEKTLADVFAKMCKKEGVGFVNLEEPFLEHWRDTGTFHRGFHTSRPWEGHYNAAGHRIAAEAMYRWIKENNHVVHPD